MVIRALLVDHPLKASLPFVVVVGDIRHEVGIASLRLRITRSLSSPKSVVRSQSASSSS